jgi:serine/threonine protein kinase
MRFQARAIDENAAPIGDYRPLVDVTKSYYGRLTVAVGEVGPHSGRIVLLRRLATDSQHLSALADAVRCGIEAEHVNVLQTLEVPDADNRIIVSEYVEGAPLSTLARVLMARRVSVDHSIVVRMMADVLDAMTFLGTHATYQPGGICPDAVLVGSDGRTRVLEAWLHGRLGDVIKFASHMDRIAYRAPEQLGDAVTADASSDVFTAGTMLWELLQKRRLFAGMGAAAVTQKILAGGVERVDGVGSALAEVVARAVASDPEDRFADPAAMASALRDALPDVASTEQVADFFGEILGDHPSTQRVKRAVDAHQQDSVLPPAPKRKGERGLLPKASRARPKPKAPRPRLDKVTHDHPADEPGLDDEVQRDSFASAFDANLDALMIDEPEPAAESSPPISEPPPSTDTVAPPDSVHPPMPDSEQLAEGAQRLVGRCEMFVEIGSADMATVYLGRWIGAGGFAKTVSVKALHPQYSRDPEFVSRFLDEAHVIARVRHPNVMPIIDVVEDAGDLFMIMEYVPGVTLAHLLRQMKRAKKKMPIDIALRIMTGVLHGLHAAHEATTAKGESMHIIHRGITPNNVLVGEDGYARLIEFSIATSLGRSSSTRVDQRKGQPRYMAPEQVSDQDATPQSDVYSAAVVLWEALTGRRLFKADNVAALTEAILHQEISAPSKRRKAVSGELDETVLRGLARDLDTRWLSAQDMVDAIDAAGGRATRRTVAAFVKANAKKRLERSHQLVALVENAPETIVDDDSFEDRVSVHLLTPPVVEKAEQSAEVVAATEGPEVPAAVDEPAIEADVSSNNNLLVAAVAVVAALFTLWFFWSGEEPESTPTAPSPTIPVSAAQPQRSSPIPTSSPSTEASVQPSLQPSAKAEPGPTPTVHPSAVPAPEPPLWPSGKPPPPWSRPKPSAKPATRFPDGI